MKDNKLNREKRIAEIMEKYDKMTPEEKQQFYECAKIIHHQSLKKRLGAQLIPVEVFQYELIDYIKTEQAYNRDEFLLFMDIFSYGVIYGKREERARKAKRHNSTGILVEVDSK